MRLISDIFEYCAAHVPRWNTISISGYHIREAGSTAAQELAFTLANALQYVDDAVSRGLDVDAFAPALLFFNCHNDFFKRSPNSGSPRPLARLDDGPIRTEEPEVIDAQVPHASGRCPHRATTAQQHRRVTIQALAAVCGEPNRCTQILR